MTTTTTLTVRRSNERGRAQHGWLDSHHTFSFANYHDPAHVGFRSLRVINEDRVAPLGGFPTHPHRDMEIFSYVVSGKLAHRDSMGNERTLEPGEVQLMSAGSGVTHSEFNPSADDAAHFLQIWIHPRERGLEPRYTEWQPPSGPTPPLTLLISADGRDGSATIAQDADIFRLRLEAGEQTDFEVRPGRGVWLQVIRGRLRVGDQVLEAGDGASTEEAGPLSIMTEGESVEALLFDLG
ncbi:pirin family protein [Haloferula sp. A504]|uniref:pirin family protein n=1 Tax=Haloferula sp. A504 TaxID=3373601 RepID=UPI0031C3CDCA|nr:pirin family protein [Verrucomicrobiaceae bacterium E54]